MIKVGKVLVSQAVVKGFFQCDLESCKGACCLEGSSGGTLERKELKILREIFPKVEPYLSEIGLVTIQKEGFFVKDSDGDFTTPLINGRECAYSYYQEGILKCAIERAFHQGEVHFQKPISCHLYPLIIKGHKNSHSLKFDYWSICQSAHVLGRKNQVSVYKFLKIPLIRCYGEAWYEEFLEKIAKNQENL